MSKLIKDEGEINGEIYSGYSSENGDDTLYFVNGKLEASAYSYEIGGVGNIDLNKKQTKEVYLSMKKFYEQ